jgi:uncharacterized protein
MKIENSFEVPGAPKETMQLLLDAERVIPCMPGAKLVEVVDGTTWKTTMAVKLGPVGMDFNNTVTLESVDEDAGTVKMGLSGRDSRGKGGAEGTVDASFTAVPGGTRVDMVTDLRFSGQAAQLGRPNIVQDVASKMVGQFADCLGSRMTVERERAVAIADGDPTTEPPPLPPLPEAKPISAISIIWAAISGAVARLFGRAQKGRS